MDLPYPCPFRAPADACASMLLHNKASMHVHRDGAFYAQVNERMRAKL